MKVWCKCINKIRDNNNNIVQYEIADRNGEHRIVTKEQLKAAVVSGALDIVNLKLTKDMKFVDRATEDEAKLMRFLTTGELSEKDDRIIVKSQLIGTAPKVEAGMLVGLPNSNTIAITPDVRIIPWDRTGNCNFEGKTLYFYGNNTISIERQLSEVDKAYIFNQTLVSNISSEKLLCKEMVLAYNDLDVKAVDIIFKTYKEFTPAKSNWKYTFSNIMVDSTKLDCDECYNRAAAILKRQKPSDNSIRRRYDLVVYMRLIKSMYTSFGDKRILALANPYIVEYNRLEGCSGHFDKNDSRKILLEIGREKIHELIAFLNNEAKGE